MAGGSGGTQKSPHRVLKTLDIERGRSQVQDLSARKPYSSREIRSEQCNLVEHWRA